MLYLPEVVGLQYKCARDDALRIRFDLVRLYFVFLSPCNTSYFSLGAHMFEPQQPRRRWPVQEYTTTSRHRFRICIHIPHTHSFQHIIVKNGHSGTLLSTRRPFVIIMLDNHDVIILVMKKTLYLISISQFLLSLSLDFFMKP
jgi:hypothetical protein